MGFDVRDGVTGVTGQRHSRTDLVGNEALNFAGRVRNHPATETPKIWKTGVGPHCYALGLGLGEGGSHDLRVAGMQSAGDVSRGNDVEDRVIVTHFPRTKAFAHVRVDIDA
ncbi:hypothetical protein D9M68_938950 [compost metagenome]